MTTTPTTHTIYEAATHTGSRLTVTARQAGSGALQGYWVVNFCRRTARARMLDQNAAWVTSRQAWDQTRWDPSGSRLVPAEALAKVEMWLMERGNG